MLNISNFSKKHWCRKKPAFILFKIFKETRPRFDQPNKARNQQAKRCFTSKIGFEVNKHVFPKKSQKRKNKWLQSLLFCSSFFDLHGFEFFWKKNLQKKQKCVETFDSQKSVFTLWNFLKNFIQKYCQFLIFKLWICLLF